MLYDAHLERFDHAALVTFDTWESGVARLPETYGKLAAWGSRYPHHDASPPDEAIANIRRWSPPQDVVATTWAATWPGTSASSAVLEVVAAPA
jgi:hypothetical protein